MELKTKEAYIVFGELGLAPVAEEIILFNNELVELIPHSTNKNTMTGIPINKRQKYVLKFLDKYDCKEIKEPTKFAKLTYTNHNNKEI
ncbi:hypothetical protein [Flavobacterium sp.]|uniref:hypothetical protein n=1 Tax=Flavobacterium sp. TaxID=239 RepID=UPI0025DC2E3D|nr:hypothetical protein [Flavobacterium sp.]